MLLHKYKGLRCWMVCGPGAAPVRRPSGAPPVPPRGRASQQSRRDDPSVFFTKDILAIQSHTTIGGGIKLAPFVTVRVIVSS